MLHNDTCPMCYEPLNSDGECVACGYYETDEYEPLPVEDEALLHTVAA